MIASPLALSRVGLVVPRHGQSAVERNRLKRRLREQVRLEWLAALALVPAVDVVLRAHREAYLAPVAALARDITNLRDRIVRAAGEPRPRADT